MEEQASFAPRTVLEQRRARLNRLAILVPTLALAAIAWVGASGAGSNRAVAESPHVAVAAPSIDVVVSHAVALARRGARYPAEVLGLDVHRLDGVDTRGLGRDTPIAVAGWYVATAITDCPPLAAIYRPASLPEIRGDADSWAFCKRSGVLYASRPDLDVGLPTNNPSNDAGLSAVAVTVTIGVVVPRELEMIGADATPVVVIGRFVESGGGCRDPAGCAQELVVDHLAWAGL